MFEFIGMAFVAWIVWKIGKSIVSGLIKGTLLRAAIYAEGVGVPSDFIEEMIPHPDVVKQARRELAVVDRAFATLDVHEQYGRAIAHLYVKARNIEMRRLKDEVEKVFRPQYQQLHNYSACNISALYISALTSELAKMTPTQIELREVFDHCFDHPNLGFARRHAWKEMISSPQLGHDLLAMAELVKREISVGKFDFFFKLREKYYDNHEQGVTEQELAVGDPHWFLKL